MFEVLERDGIARIGEWTLDKKVQTPNILFITTERIKPFINAEIFISKDKIKSDKPYVINKGRNFIKKKSNGETIDENITIPPHIIYPPSCKELSEDLKLYKNEKVIVQTKEKIENNAELHVLPNALELVKHPKKFVEHLVKLKQNVSYQSLIYTPGLGEPHTLALFVYMGIDLFDSLPLIFNARKGYFLTENGKWQIYENIKFPCFCPACQNEKLDFENLLNHNYFAALQEIRTIKLAINEGKLRELVETRIRTDPSLVSILRILDFEYYQFQEQFFPITRKTKIQNGKEKNQMICTSLESLYRPEVERFRQRMKTIYNKPEFAKILLFIPCSAKKPYSFSKSHNLFRNVIRNSINPSIVHEVIITSPLGLVPRELELFYPAQNYDIPVTGNWNLEEKEMILELLKYFIDKNSYDTIISHLPKNLDFIDEVLDEKLNTCINTPTSNNSLDKLRKTLNKVCEPYERIKIQNRTNQLLKNFSVFQFGDAGKKILENASVKGRYPYLKIIKDKQLAMLIKERGMLSLTLEGGKILAKEKKYCMQIEDFKPMGSVFAVGVTDANPEIRIGDDVIILHKDEIKGVGVALMSSKEMIESKRGIAVNVRHAC